MTDGQRTRVDYWPPALEDLVGRITYKAGWSVWLAEEFEDVEWGHAPGGLKLFIVSDTPDSYNPTRKIRVRHEFLVPRASYTRDVWAAWLFDRYRDVETHEAGEFFQIDGVREFAPHHGNGEDPYRVWHVGDYADIRVKAGESK
jgi:hypothetical protein